MTTTRQIVLAQRPNGWPTPDDFRLEEVELPALGDGQVLVRNTAMSVDPYMRGRMNEGDSYVPAFQVDQPLDGAAVGEVIETTSDEVAVGTTVLHGLGWREHAVLDAGSVTPVDTSQVSATAYLGVLGMPGLTAYTGLLAAGEFSAGDTVFVSGAAGAVGSLVGQIAKALGAERVIGSAGSPDKIARLQELGFDVAFNYKDGDISGQLAKAAPEGIDVYFDNVGGEHLEAALDALKVDGHAAVCGMISSYNSTEPQPAPRNLALLIGKRLTVRGFLVGKYVGMREEFLGRMVPWVTSGEIRFDETFRDGLEQAPSAFVEMMQGANLGKMVVRL